MLSDDPSWFLQSTAAPCGECGMNKQLAPFSNYYLMTVSGTLFIPLDGIGI